MKLTRRNLFQSLLAIPMASVMGIDGQRVATSFLMEYPHKDRDVPCEGWSFDAGTGWVIHANKRYVRVVYRGNDGYGFPYVEHWESNDMKKWSKIA